MNKHFSARQGHRPINRSITVREDAPTILREAIIPLAENLGMTPQHLRNVICRVLLKRPDSDNWSDSPVLGEIESLVENAPWNKVYDILEAIYDELSGNTPFKCSQDQNKFKLLLNDFFVENGIGWELREGKIIHRGSEFFTNSTREVPQILNESGYERAANEIREALSDISRIPDPDITGAIQHAMAALEATAREVTGQRSYTLGKLVPMLDLPSPLDQAVTKLWGFASDRGRHICEQQTINRTEAELIVTIAGSLCAYVAQMMVTMNPAVPES